MNKSWFVGCALAIVSLPASANVGPYNLNDTSRVYDLDEVTVIRQPKEQYRLRLQPISSSMYSEADVAMLSTRDLRELSSYVPNFTMPNYGSRYTSSIYMRGTGSRVNSPSVGIYVDGVPLMSKSAFNTHTYDLARVDVLRGPQGTLYGLNNEAGLVRLYTKNPMDYQGTDLKIGGGSHFYRNAEIAHYNKVNDYFAFSIAGFYDGQDGFFKNKTLDEYSDKYNEAGGRLKLMFNPSDRWKINFLTDYQYTRQNGFPYGLIGEDGVATDPNTNKQHNYRRNMLNTALGFYYHGKTVDFSSMSSYQYLKDYMMMDIDYSPADFMEMQERQLQNSYTQEFTLKSNKPVDGFWNWTVGAFGGFSWLKTNSDVDFGGDMDAFLGNTIQKAMYNAMVHSMAGRFIAQGMSPEAAAKQAAAVIERAGGVSMTTDMKNVPGVYRTPTYNFGLYHESNFDIADRLTATLGLRYDWNYVRIDYESSAAVSSVAKVMGREAAVTVSSLLKDRRHSHSDQLLPKFGLTYRLADNGSNIYATVSKGYRAGGYNIQMFSDILQTEIQSNSSQRADYEVPHTEEDYEKINQTIVYKPETSWNYEAGAHLNLLDGRMQMDLAAFYMQIHNQQLSQMAGNYGFGRMMTNAGKSMSCGIEAALRGKAFDDHLSWRLNYGFTHASFDEYTDTVMVKGEKTMVDYKDNKVPFIPEHNFAAALDYRFDLASGDFVKSITIGANVNGQGKTYWDEANTMSQNFYAVLGAHLGFDFGKLKLDVWGRNLTDSRYNVFAVSSGATGKTNWFAQRGNPFQIGADLKFHF
ncbi:MAG: TonB-dependent receptor [Prevotella sp.]|jgi:iron complex outermembrane receptor protein